MDSHHNSMYLTIRPFVASLCSLRWHCSSTEFGNTLVVKPTKWANQTAGIVQIPAGDIFLLGWIYFSISLCIHTTAHLQIHDILLILGTQNLDFHNFLKFSRISTPTFLHLVMIISYFWIWFLLTGVRGGVRLKVALRPGNCAPAFKFWFVRHSRFNELY